MMKRALFSVLLSLVFFAPLAHAGEPEFQRVFQKKRFRLNLFYGNLTGAGFEPSLRIDENWRVSLKVGIALPLYPLAAPYTGHLAAGTFEIRRSLWKRACLFTGAVWGIYDLAQKSTTVNDQHFKWAGAVMAGGGVRLLGKENRGLSLEAGLALGLPRTLVSRTETPISIYRIEAERSYTAWGHLFPFLTLVITVF